MIRACPSCGAKNRIPDDRLDQKASCGRCKTALLPLVEPVEVPSTRAFDELVTGSPLPVLVDFWAPWCGPCRAVAPELRKLAKSFSGRLVVAKVDTDSLPDLAARYDVPVSRLRTGCPRVLGSAPPWGPGTTSPEDQEEKSGRLPQKKDNGPSPTPPGAPRRTP